MKKTYQTFEEKAKTFIHIHQPENTKSKKLCKSFSLALLSRSILHTVIPVSFGIASGIMVKWTNIKIDGPEYPLLLSDNNTLLEASDLCNSAITLLVAYSVNKLINQCWPASPYLGNGIFNQPANNDDNKVLLTTLSEELDQYHA